YLYKRKAVQMISMAEQFVREDMVKQAYQVNVMLVVGVLIYGLRQTEFVSIIAKGLTYMQAHYSLINPLFILPLIVLALGFLGLGPLTVMVLVAGIVSGMELPYSPELIVLSITSGSVLANLLSPVVMPVI